MSLIIACIIIFIITGTIVHIYIKNWNSNLKVSVSFVQENLREGEVGQIQEVISNEKKLPLFSLLVKFPVDVSITYKRLENIAKSDKQYRNDFFSIKKYEKITRTFDVEYTKRGFYSIPMVDLVATDFFYSSRLVERRENSTHIYIYPTATSIPEIAPIMERMIGEYLNQRFLYEDPFEFRGIRNYEPTDAMNKINWKITAKMGEVMVNQYYETIHSSVTLFLNLESEGMKRYDQLLEEAIRMARSCLEICVHKGIPIRICTNGIDIETKKPIQIEEGAGPGHFDSCLKKLARIDTKEISSPLSELIKREATMKHGLAILITVSQAKDLMEEYETFLGRSGFGLCFVPIHTDIDRTIKSNRIHVTYGEVNK